jgi:hypothetical protein
MIDEENKEQKELEVKLDDDSICRRRTKRRSTSSNT